MILETTVLTVREVKRGGAVKQVPGEKMRS
jgi:hypothetical protein